LSTGNELPYTHIPLHSLFGKTEQMLRKRRSRLHESVTSKSKPTITVTPTTWQNLTQIANKVKLSKSALVEGVAKGKIAIASNQANIKIDLDRVSGTFNQINGFAFVPNNNTSQKSKSFSINQATETISLEAYQALQTQLTEKNNLIEELRQKLQGYTIQLEQQNQTFQSWQQELKVKDEQIQEQSSLINRLKQQLEEQASQLKQQNQNFQSWQQELTIKNEQIPKQSREQLTESDIAQTENNKLKVRITVLIFIIFAAIVTFLLKYYYSHI
jgi:chromosome segregation ATPase